MRSSSARATSSRNPTKKSISITVGAYLVSVDAGRFYKNRRFFWTVAATEAPEELLSWGDSPTRALAVAAANEEIEKLKSGSTGGRVKNLKLRDRQDIRVL